MQEMVGAPESSNFGGMVVCWIRELTYSVRRTFFGVWALVLHFYVHKSLTNLAYGGIFLIASKRGIVIFTYLKTSNIS